MGGCMCYWRPPASKNPVKRYNLLVPDIFPINPPKVDQDLPAAVIKKIEKLGEYLTKNQQRASKVSRRLDRRIRKELSRREPNSGYIKIAVHAYTYLLAQDNVNFYALELIKRDDSVIRLLLDHHSIHLKILGAELLAHFLRQQNDSDNLTALNAFVPTLCRNCQKEVPALVHGVEGKEKEDLTRQLKVACLRGIREHVGLMQRLSADPVHLDLILASVLDNLECVPGLEDTIHSGHSDEATLSPRTTSSPRTASSPRTVSSPVARIRNLSVRRQFERQKSTSMDFKFFQKHKIPEDFSSASTPSQVASQVMAELGSLTKAAGNAEAVLQCLLHQLDQRNHWSDEGTVRTVFSMMREAYARQHQQFLLFTVVLRHAAVANDLPIKQRTSLIQLAIDEGLRQDIHLAVSVLVHCLAHLPMQLPPPALRRDGLIHIAPDIGAKYDSMAMAERRGIIPVERHPLVHSPKKIGDPDEFALRDKILQGIGSIAERAEGALQLVDTLVGVLKRFNWPAGEGDSKPGEEIPVLECVLAAAEAASTFPEETSRLPVRKYEQVLQELFSLVVNVSTHARSLTNKLIRLVLPLAPTPDYVLPHFLTASFLSSLYYVVEDTKNSPEMYAELGATFGAMLLRSNVKCTIPALQLIHTLWSQAIEKDKAGRLGQLDPPHRCAVLMLCRAMISGINYALRLNISARPWTASLEPLMSPCLKLDDTVLFATTAEFPPSLKRPCLSFLTDAVSSDVVMQEMLNGLREHKTLQTESSQEICNLPSSSFIPDNLISLQCGTKSMQLSTCSSVESSAYVNEAEGMNMDLSTKVASMLQPALSEKFDAGMLLENDMNPKADGDCGDQESVDLPTYTLEQVLEMVDNNLEGTGAAHDEGLDFNDLALDINPIGS